MGKRESKKWPFRGGEYSSAEIARTIGVAVTTVNTRIKLGEPIDYGVINWANEKLNLRMGAWGFLPGTVPARRSVTRGEWDQ